MEDKNNNDLINIRICTGTTCYVMGASDLLTLEDYIPGINRNSIRISGATCLGFCRDKKLKPPFVEIDGEIISQADLEKVLEIIKAKTGGLSYADNE